MVFLFIGLAPLYTQRGIMIHVIVQFMIKGLFLVEYVFEHFLLGEEETQYWLAKRSIKALQVKGAF